MKHWLGPERAILNKKITAISIVDHDGDKRHAQLCAVLELGLSESLFWRHQEFSLRLAAHLFTPQKTRDPRKREDNHKAKGLMMRRVAQSEKLMIRWL